MASNTDNEITRVVAIEETPLLDNGRGKGRPDDGSKATLMGLGKKSQNDLGDSHDAANQHVAKARGFLIVLSLWGLIFLQASNMSGITTTQSKIAEDLDAFEEASWFTSAYLIAMSSTSPLVAKLAEIFSPRNCILAAALLIAIGGIVTSQATGLQTFLLGRVVTGLGASGVMTVSFILVLELSGKKRRGLFFGLLNTGFTIGLSFGAIIFGALLESMGWPFLFWAQAPLALISGIGVFYSIPKGFTSGHKGAGEGSALQKLARIDYLGAVTLTSAICLLFFGLSFEIIQWMPIVMSMFVLLAFIFIEIRLAYEPVIPVTVLKSKGALLTCVAQLGIMAARWMVLFYTPTYALAIRGWSPPSAGSILIPTNFGFALGGIVAGWLHIKRAGSFYLASLISYISFAVTLIVLSQISTPSTPAPLYFLAVFVNGLSTGAAVNYTLAHLLHLTPLSTHFVSIALLNTFRAFSGSFGSAIGGGLFLRTLEGGLEEGFEEHGGIEGRKDLIRRLLGSPALVNGLKGIEKSVAIQSYVGALRGLFLSGVVLAIGMVVIQACTGWKAGIELQSAEQDQTMNEGNLVGDDHREDRMEQSV